MIQIQAVSHFLSTTTSKQSNGFHEALILSSRAFGKFRAILLFQLRGHYRGKRFQLLTDFQ